MEKDCYSTRDLSIAAFLLATNIVTLSSTKKKEKEIYFLFAPREKAEELAQLYWSDKAPSIQPRQLFQSLRSLKDLIFSGG